MLTCMICFAFFSRYVVIVCPCLRALVCVSLRCALNCITAVYCTTLSPLLCCLFIITLHPLLLSISLYQPFYQLITGISFGGYAAVPCDANMAACKVEVIILSDSASVILKQAPYYCCFSLLILLTF